MTGTKRRWVEVKLLGELGRKFGRIHRFMALNAREVISALSKQIEGFQAYLSTAHENGIGFRLVTNDAMGIGYEETLLSCDRLVMAPIITGAGSNIGQILIGAALIALSFVSFGAGAFAGVGTAGAFGSTALFSLGASLFLTGIAGLLSPPVQTPSSDTKKKESFMFDRAAELTTQGYPVPVLYGRYLLDSPLIISSAIATEQIPV